MADNIELNLNLTNKEALLLSLLVNVNGKTAAQVVLDSKLYKEELPPLLEVLTDSNLKSDLWVKVGYELDKRIVKNLDLKVDSIYDLSLEEIVNLFAEEL